MKNDLDNLNTKRVFAITTFNDCYHIMLEHTLKKISQYWDTQWTITFGCLVGLYPNYYICDNDKKITIIINEQKVQLITKESSQNKKKIRLPLRNLNLEYFKELITGICKYIDIYSTENISIIESIQ